VNPAGKGAMTATDILERIDSAVDGRCACGCGRPLDPAGPSGWWATEECQYRWQSRRTVVRLPGFDLDVDPATLQAAWTRAATLIGEAVAALRPALEQMAEVITKACRAVAPLVDPQPPADPREWALWHVRHRHTGPPVRLAVPRRVDPPAGLRVDRVRPPHAADRRRQHRR
jgi:hypothetical protein